MPKYDESGAWSRSTSGQGGPARDTIGSALRSLPIEFGIFDSSEQLVLASEGLTRRCGLDRDRLAGTPLKEVVKILAAEIDAIDGERVAKQSAASSELLARLRKSISKTLEIGFKNGESRLLTIHRANGVGCVLQFVDFTDKRNAAESERHASELVRRVLEACPFALVMARLEDRKILYESPANNVMFGEEEHTKAEHIGVYDVDPSRREEYTARLRRDGFVDDFEMRFRALDGREFVSTLSGRLIDFDGEEVIVSGAVDLTERRAVEAELARQREALFQSEKLSALGQLLAGVAHELNNPLSVVVGHAMLLRELTSDPDIASRVEKIGAAAERCARIVKSFLAMARQRPITSQPVDMNEVVKTALDVTGYALRSANVEVDLKMAGELPPVSGDPGQLGQVITNLVINAQQALEERRPPRRLCIETFHHEPAASVVVKVKDNGAGVPKELRSRIFEPLFTTKEIGGGTGIGLALCHRIVETHNGDIALESSIGDGAIFSIKLPTMERDGGITEAASEEGDFVRGLRVLIVDDEPDVAGLLKDVLVADAHRCEVAQSGIEALRALERAGFDIIICDLRMPGLSGQGLYDVVVDRFPDLVCRMGFITGDTLSHKSRAFLRKARRPYIEKPITTDDVRDLILRITNRR